MSRHAAFFALLNWHQKGTFLWDSLEKWKVDKAPSPSDLNFAYELACGSLRMQRQLDYIIKTVIKKRPAKEKERIILRLALYQYYFLPNIPAYAVVDSSVKLAKEQCHSSFASFLNAVLRKIERKPIETTDLGIVHSYPDLFVELLSSAYGLEKCVDILERGNKPSALTGLLYTQSDAAGAKPLEDPLIASCGLKMYFLDAPNPIFYIQNRTQPKLLAQLSKGLKEKPKRILDMCAAPGGKSLLLHHLYPDAKLTVNDSSQHKIKRLSENLQRFSCNAKICNAEILCQNGEELQSDHRFDLILIDAPCSNSGVLYKCPEARWRITEETLNALAETQRKLIARAMHLLTQNGKIWFMTCSILPQENEQHIAALAQELGLQVDGDYALQLPDFEGHEGGFACQLSLKSD